MIDNREFLFVVNMLNDYLNENKTEKQDNLDWNIVTELCRVHNINGILYYQCSGFLPDEYETQLCLRYGAEVNAYNVRVNYLNEITDEFEKCGIVYSMCKGFEIARYYPVPALRTMGDCDIIVKKNDLEKADSVMQKLCFELADSSAVEYCYYKNKKKFEIHYCLFDEDEYSNEKIVEFSDLLWDYCNPCGNSLKYTIDINYHFVYLLLHLRRHLLFSGAGLRQFADIDVTVEKNQLDWEWIENKLTQLDLTDFAYVCFDFCNRCFGTRFGIEYKKLTESAFDNVFSAVLKNGVFGFDNSDNSEAYLFVYDNAKNKNSYMLKKYVRLIFPTYEDMCYGDNYSFIKGKKPLLPLAWIYRWFYVAFHREKINNSVNKMNTLDEKAKKRYDKLSDWGLN